MSMFRWPIAMAIVTVFLVGVPLIDLLNGFLLSVYGNSQVAVLYKALVAPLICIVFFIRKIKKSQLLLVSTMWLCIAALIALPALAGEHRVNTTDLTVLSRGPLLLSFVLLLTAFLRNDEKVVAANFYFGASWWTITGSILILNALGMSMATYEGSDAAGIKGVYAAGNEVTIVYMLSWWFLIFEGARSHAAKVGYTIATLVMLFFIGTKSGFVVFGIVALWQLLTRIGLTPVKSTIVFVAVSVLTVVFAVDIFLFLGPFLKGWDRLIFFIQRYDAVTAMTGGRFLSLPYIAALFSGFGPFEMLFGLGFKSFWGSVSSSSVESDIIDLFGGAGLLGVLLFYGILSYCMTSILREPRLAKWGGLILAVVLYSVFVGHVAFAATPVISIAVAISAFLGARRLENSNRSFVVQQPRSAKPRELHSGAGKRAFGKRP